MSKDLKKISYYIMLLFLINSILTLYRFFNGITKTIGVVFLSTWILSSVIGLLTYIGFKIISTKIDNKLMKISSWSLIILTILGFFVSYFSLGLNIFALIIGRGLAIIQIILIILLVISIFISREKFGILSIIIGIILIFNTLGIYAIAFLLTYIYPDMNFSNNISEIFSLILLLIEYTFMVLFFFRASNVLEE